jgi:hypothetical protein
VLLLTTIVERHSEKRLCDAVAFHTLARLDELDLLENIRNSTRITQL